MEGFCQKGSSSVRLARPERQGKFVLTSVLVAKPVCASVNLNASGILVHKKLRLF